MAVKSVPRSAGQFEYTTCVHAQRVEFITVNPLSLAPSQKFGVEGAAFSFL